MAKTILIITLFFGFSSYTLAQKIEWIDAASSGNLNNTGFKLVHGKNQRLLFSLENAYKSINFHNQTFTAPNTSINYNFYLISSYDTSGKFKWNFFQNDLSEISEPNKKQSIFFIRQSQLKNSYVPSLNELDSNGHLVWSKPVIDTFDVGFGIYDIEIDALSNIYMACAFYNTILVNGKTITAPIRNIDCRVIKTDPNGNFLWIKPLFQSHGLQGLKIFPDKAGNVYYYGSIYDSLKINSIKYYAPNGRLAQFTGKLDPLGTHSWFHFMNSDFSQLFDGDLDEKGNLYIASNFKDTADIAGIKLKTVKDTATFIAKMDSNGRPVWANAWPFLNSGTQTAIDDPALSLDGVGNLFSAGNLKGQIFTSLDTISSGADSQQNIFYINKLDTSGKLKWTRIFNNSNKRNRNSSASIRNIRADTGGVYFTGGFSETARLDGLSIYTPPEYAIMTGKMAYGPIYLPDSISVKHNVCTDAPWFFHLYYNTTPDSVFWDFGDGIKSRLLHPAHTYTHWGTFIVKLLAYVQGHSKGFSLTIHNIDFKTKLLPLDTSLCPGKSLHINLSNLGTGNLTWNNGDTLTIKNLDKAGIYSIIALGSGCKRTDSFRLRYRNLRFSLGRDTSLCAHKTLILNGPTWPNARYLWNDGNTAPSYTVTQGGKYSLMVTDSNCISSDTINISYNLFPQKFMPSDTSLCVAHPININIGPFNGNILWQDGNHSNHYIISDAGTYTVTLKNNCGQMAYDITVKDSNCNCLFYIPNIFTPNNDSHNEIFNPVTSCALKNYTLQIYNRWGERIFQSNAINQGWDGRFHGSACPNEVYVYMILYQFQNDIPQIRQGTIILGR